MRNQHRLRARMNECGSKRMGDEDGDAVEATVSDDGDNRRKGQKRGQRDALKIWSRSPCRTDMLVPW